MDPAQFYETTVYNHVKKDGSPMTSSQISARVSKYPTLFERLEDGRIALRRRAT